jgi:hypothetical protein
MTDKQIGEIYAFGRDAFQGGQSEFQIEAFPFRMTAQNMARYRNDPNYHFWQMLKEGYDHFEITRVPPKVDVCEKRYVFDRIPVNPGATFSPTGPCPESTLSPALQTAYQSYQSSYQKAFEAAANDSGGPPPSPTILGIQEAKLVADWTRRRGRGERITVEPPSMAADGTISMTSQMGRIDSDVGRKMAAKEAAEAEKKRIAEEKAAELAAQKAAKAAAKAAKEHPPVVTPAPEASPPTDTASAQPEEQDAGILGSMRKKIGSIFGG